MRNRFLFPVDVDQFPDVYTFQESHSSPEMERYWNSVLPGQLVYSHGSSHARGVLVGIHSRFSLSLKSSVADPESRYVIVECMQGDECFTLVSVYFEPQITLELLVEILTTIAKKVDELGHNRVLWTGDFNIVLNPQVDSTAVSQKAPTGTKARARKQLLPFIDEHELTDMWRAMHPFDIRYTVQSKTLNTRCVHSRVDYYLSSPALSTAVLDTDIKPLI